LSVVSTMQGLWLDKLSNSRDSAKGAGVPEAEVESCTTVLQLCAVAYHIILGFLAHIQQS
jgi:hypothetical protein